MRVARGEVRNLVVIAWVAALLYFQAPNVFGLLAGQDATSTSDFVADLRLGVYDDTTCARNVTVIDWGICDPGENKTAPIYLRNDGNVNVTLTIQPANWEPSLAASHLTLSSNCAAEVLTPGEVRPITLTLAISDDVESVDAFRFDIVIASHDVP
jgi:hypothetical protein